MIENGGVFLLLFLSIMLKKNFLVYVLMHLRGLIFNMNVVW